MSSRKKERNINELKPHLKRALEEYVPDLVKDSEEAYALKEQVQKLSEVDRIIFILYVELQSYTELSRVLGVSRSTLWWEIKRIKEILRGMQTSSIS